MNVSCIFFFFAALCPRLTVHLLRLWGGGVVTQPGKKEGSADESLGEGGAEGKGVAFC